MSTRGPMPQARARSAVSAAEPAARSAAGPPKGRIFNIQRFSTDDGPGIRTTVFLKGCPLACPWCANPESQRAAREVVHSDALCDRCGRCVAACERGAVQLAPSGGVAIDRARCDACAACVPVCGPRALRVIGADSTLEEVFEEIRRDAPYYESSGGGVTCSGGEPLSQARFVAALFERCRKAGYHTALDTCGAAPRRALEEVLPHTDLVLFDFKIADGRRHAAVTGRSNRRILENARLVAERGVAMIARVPVVPGYTDGEDNIAEIAAFVRGLNPGIPVHLLPYHRFGVHKYRMLDRDYALGETRPPAREDMERLAERVRLLGLQCEALV